MVFHVGDQDEVLTSTQMRERHALSHIKALRTRRAQLGRAQEAAGRIGNTSWQLQICDEAAAYFASFERTQCRDPIWRYGYAPPFSFVKPNFRNVVLGAEGPFQRPSKAGERSSGQNRFCRRAFRFVPGDRVA